MYSSNDHRLLLLLINHVMESLSRIRLQKKLEIQAVHDPLTGVYNRFYLYHQLELIEKKGNNQSLAFLMIDVNDLKKINDRYGHQKGDEVLRTVADLLLSVSGSNDSVVRYGGDEFLIIMPGIGQEVAEVKKDLTERLFSWNRDNNPFEFPISLAVGIASRQENEVTSFRVLLSEADKKMYIDKKAVKAKQEYIF